MAKEYIERETAMFAEEAAFDGDGFSRNHAVAAIKGITAADVKPVVHGRWVISKPGEAWACSKCGTEPYYARDVHTLNFCPNCGADMREVN